MTVYPKEQAPALELSAVDGNKVNLTDIAKDNDFTIVVFYRGIFCPICKMYLKEIEENYEALSAANMKVVAISMDTEEKAKTFASEVAVSVNESSLKTTIAYGMIEKQAREWGLYISKGREGTAEPAVFSEPGLFVLKPDNSVFMAMTQSAPFTRPSIPQLIGGLSYAQEHKYPARGTLTKTPTPLEQ